MQLNHRAPGKDRSRFVHSCRVVFWTVPGRASNRGAVRRPTPGAKMPGGIAGSVTWKQKKAPNDHFTSGDNLTAL